MNAVVIAAPDPAVAASFALGIARVHGSVRRVAIADLVGEVAPLQALVQGDDSHGISDSFLYGVSLNRIAQPLEGSGNVFLMPSGTEPVATEGVYSNDRWRKLAAGFQQVGALLIIVAVAKTPGFTDLCSYAGAVFPIDGLDPVMPVGVATIAMPRPTPPEVERVAKKAREVGSEDMTTRRNRIIASVMATIGVALLVGFLWPQIVERLPTGIATLLPGAKKAAATTDTLPRNADSAKSATAKTDSVAPTPAVSPVAAVGTDSAAIAAGTSDIALVVANPADSAKASAYSVYLGAASTAEAAQSDPRVTTLPAVAITPVVLGNDGAHWYRTLIGASEDQQSAAALLARMRAAKVVGPTSSNIVRAPYAFQLQKGLTAEASSNAIAEYAKRDVWAYALRQSDGTITVYTGAHESVAQAAILAGTLRTMGIAPVLVYRTGRAF